MNFLETLGMVRDSRRVEPVTLHQHAISLENALRSLIKPSNASETPRVFTWLLISQCMSVIHICENNPLFGNVHDENQVQGPGLSHCVKHLLDVALR